MNTQELKGYLKAVIDVNQSIYELPSLISKIEDDIKRLELARRSISKEEYKVKHYKKPNYNQIYESALTDIVCEEGIYPEKYSYILDFGGLSGKKKYIARISDKETWKSEQAYVSRYVWHILSNDIKLNHKYKKDFEKASANATAIAEVQYQEKYESYLLLNKEADEKELESKNECELKEDLRVQQEQFKKEMLEKELSLFRSNLVEAKVDLEQLLDANIIHTKYRSFPCICSLYEYIDTGRCTDLVGPFGAYQRYEEQVVAGNIIESLSNIEHKLDQISNNQATLAMAIKQCSKNIEDGFNSVNTSIDNHLLQLEKNEQRTGDILSDFKEQSIGLLSSYNEQSVATRYNLERIRKITEFANSVKLANGEFEGFEYVYPC